MIEHFKFTVRKYKEVNIREITTDKLSPQKVNENILIKAIVDGDRTYYINMLYKVHKRKILDYKG